MWKVENTYVLAHANLLYLVEVSVSCSNSLGVLCAFYRPHHVDLGVIMLCNTYAKQNAKTTVCVSFVMVNQTQLLSYVKSFLMLR